MTRLIACEFSGRVRDAFLAQGIDAVSWPGPDRWKIRSTTYPGLARAMASQWGVLTQPSINGNSNPKEQPHD